MNTYTYMLPAGIILAGVAVGAFFFFGGVPGAQSLSSPPPKQATHATGETIPDNARRLTLSIEGMFCAGCARSIESSLSAVPGVVRSKVDPQSGSGQVVYDPSQVSKEEIVDKPIFATYPAEITDDVKVTSRKEANGSPADPAEH
jgi:copper chaperone CopZ